jgi:UDP-N-acetylglucosamine acyltransferase
VQDAPPFCTVQGDRARLAGLNETGLKRAGYAPAENAALRRAYRLLFLGSAPMAERIAAARTLPGPAVAALTDFMEASGRGVISTPRRRAA